MSNSYRDKLKFFYEENAREKQRKRLERAERKNKNKIKRLAETTEYLDTKYPRIKKL